MNKPSLTDLYKNYDKVLLKLSNGEIAGIQKLHTPTIHFPVWLVITYKDWFTPVDKWHNRVCVGELNRCYHKLTKDVDAHIVGVSYAVDEDEVLWYLKHYDKPNKLKWEWEE